MSVLCLTFEALLASLVLHAPTAGAATGVASCEAEIVDLSNMLLLQTDHHLGASAGATAAPASYLPEVLRQPQTPSAGVAASATPQPTVATPPPAKIRARAGLEIEASKLSQSGGASAPVTGSISGSLPLTSLVEMDSAVHTYSAQVWIWVVVLLLLALCVLLFVDFGKAWALVFGRGEGETMQPSKRDSVRKSRGSIQSPASPAETLLSQPPPTSGIVEGVDDNMQMQARDSEIKRRSSRVSSNAAPPLLCPSLVLPNTEARFMVDMDVLKAGVVSGNLNITGTSGRKLLHGTVCEMGSTRVFKLCSVDCEEDPRATVHTDASGIMKIFGRGGEFYGDLEPSGNAGMVLICDGRPAMTVELRDPIDLQMTACTMDGRQLAQAARAQLPARRQACLAEGSSGVVWRLQVKPGADAVLTASTMLSMLLLRSNKLGEIWQPTPSK